MKPCHACRSATDGAYIECSHVESEVSRQSTSVNREQGGSITGPTRKACVDCKTVRGRLRRACPYCWRPVCDDCYPHRHSCDDARKRELARPGKAGEK